MPELNVVTVDTDGLEVDIDITKPGGGAATAYTSAAGTTPISLPATISTPTQFWVAEAGDFTFIISKVGGDEVHREVVGVSDRDDQPKTLLLKSVLPLSAIVALATGGGSGASVPSGFTLTGDDSEPRVLTIQSNDSPDPQTEPQIVIKDANGVTLVTISGTGAGNDIAVWGGGEDFPRVVLNANGLAIGDGSTDPTSGLVDLYMNADNVLYTDAKFVTGAGFGTDAATAATTPGTVTKKMEMFDGNGDSIGFVAIFDAIT